LPPIPRRSAIATGKARRWRTNSNGQEKLSPDRGRWGSRCQWRDRAFQTRPQLQRLCDGRPVRNMAAASCAALWISRVDGNAPGGGAAATVITFPGDTIVRPVGYHICSAPPNLSTPGTFAQQACLGHSDRSSRHVGSGWSFAIKHLLWMPILYNAERPDSCPLGRAMGFLQHLCNFFYPATVQGRFSVSMSRLQQVGRLS
jgi:hypothetical protein